MGNRYSKGFIMGRADRKMTPDPKPHTIRLKGKAKTEFRREVAERAKYHCENCGRHTPSLIYGVFDVFNCGHVSHIKSYGSGGGDTLDNVKWKCYKCHILIEHWKENG